MIIHDAVRRRVARDLARVGAACCALMVGVSALTYLDGGDAAFAAATNAGTFQLVGTADSASSGEVLTTGGSATAFAIDLPDGAACTGDTTNDSYRVQTYMVPGSTDPATITFSSTGLTSPGQGANLRQPLYDTNRTKVINRNTAPKDAPGQGGLIVGLPGFDYTVYQSGKTTAVPPGTYNIGVACTLGPAGPDQLDKFWNLQITIAADENDQPSGFTWTVVAQDTGTTTTTTSGGGATTSTAGTGGSTSTTTGGGGNTTSTTAGGNSSTSTSNGSSSSSTSSSLGAAAVSTTNGGSGVGGTSFVGDLPRTGKSATAMIVWSVLLVILGRMAILLGRPPKVIPATG